MKMLRTARLLPSLALLALLAPLSGCDWLSPSGSATRSSPAISNLAIAPTSVFCGPRNPLVISFGYGDKQGDYYQLHLRLEQPAPGPRLLRTVAWSDLDLRTSAGRAIYGEFFFECGTDPAGAWTLTVAVEDERGHLSNELTAEITLISSR